MTSKHEDPPGDAMPCDFAQGKKTRIQPQSRSVLLIGWSMKKTNQLFPIVFFITMPVIIPIIIPIPRVDLSSG